MNTVETSDQIGALLIPRRHPRPRRRIVVLLNRAIVLGEVEVGTFRLDESDLLAVKAFADGVTA